MNENIDLGLKLGRLGQIYLCLSAQLAHYHDPSGRMPPYQAAEDDLFNRYMVLYWTVGRSRLVAIGNVTAFIIVESLSNLLGSFRRGSKADIGSLFCGRVAGLLRVIRTATNFQGGPNT